MVSFEALEAWLTAEAEALRAKGFVVRVKCSDVGSKPGGCLEAEDNRAAGLLSVWVSGEADIDIVDLQTKEMAVLKWGLRMTDANHTEIFREFAEDMLSLRRSD